MRWLWLLVTLVLLWLGGFIRFVADLPRAPDHPSRVTDAVVVLTGGAQRMEAGLNLLRQPRADRLFVSGVNPSVSKTMMPTYAENADLFECCVELGHLAQNTAGNAVEIAGWAAANHVRSLRVVTAAYHMPRTMLELRQRLRGVSLLAWPVSPPGGRAQDWRSAGTAAVLAGEYTKYLGALVRVWAEGALPP
jgi:uncharacterized SAM-binding protein YcdF (DUF218 family)